MWVSAKILNISKHEEEVMVSISELRVCKGCGNIFSKKAGVTNILECPQCKQTNFDTVSLDPEELTQE
ncbi:MAG: hypothetical protein P8X83_03120 [Nitrosopumilaceae archaeon]